jgi:hypothetical protein
MAMADDFYDDEDPYFLVCDRLDAGEDPRRVYEWAAGRRRRAKGGVQRDQWDEALSYISAEYPELGLG